MIPRSSALTMTARVRGVTVLLVDRVRELWVNDRGRLVHYLVAASLAVYLVVEYATLKDIIGDPVDSRWWVTGLAVISAIALLFSREYPFVAPVVSLAALAVTLVLLEPYVAREALSPFFVAILFVPWCLGTYNETRWAIAGLVVAEAVGFWANVRFAESGADFIFVGAAVAIAWTVGFVLNRRAEHTRELVETARRLEREQIDASERAVAEERQRIARELHDVIAHSVSVMTVQAGAVRRLLKPEQDKERKALETVEATGREALTEMRRLVGLLREQGAMPEFSPQPGMGTIDSLLDGVRAAGLPVELEVSGAPRELPPGVDLAAYRVVQEALTNALKYAGPAHAWVAVTWNDGDLELEIANDGRGDGDGSGGGHGLAGMRERVSLYGGEIESGDRSGGGYVVRARLPLEEASP
jgi:signal transduction histidine kinase